MNLKKKKRKTNNIVINFIKEMLCRQEMQLQRVVISRFINHMYKVAVALIYQTS